MRGGWVKEKAHQSVRQHGRGRNWEKGRGIELPTYDGGYETGSADARRHIGDHSDGADQVGEKTQKKKT